MKTLIHIRGLFPDRIGKNVYEHLETLYPEGKGAHIFGALGLPAEDERVQALVAYLTEVNFSREMYFERVYEPEDYAQSEYFKIMPVDNFGSVSERNSSGDLVLQEAYVQGVEIGRDWRIPGLAVSDRMKNLMEQAGLERINFRKTDIVVDPRKHLKFAPRQPYSEVLSDLILPPLRATSETGFLYGPEYHYTSQEIQDAGPFDLAQTHEYPGDNVKLGRNWVASKVFCDFCNAQKLPIVWRPVRIDEV